MNRIILKKLVFLGGQKGPAVIDFEPGFNVVSGPSDTGKSLLFECISYVLGGATKPKQPSETDGYTNLFLTVSLGETLATIERSILSNDVRVYASSYEDIKGVTPENLSGSAQAKNNISDYLMKIFGIENKKLKKNESDEVISLTFNVLKNLILIDEGKIQAPVSPVFSGINTAVTSDQALFKFLIKGVEYSNAIAKLKPAERKIDVNARIDVLRQLIEESAFKDDNLSSLEELKKQKAQLDLSIEAEMTQISESQKEIEDLQAKRKIAWNESIYAETKADQRKEILARFNLLAVHYENDLDRLDATIETGELLVGSEQGDCPLCGAKPEFHRPDCIIDAKEILHVRESCEAEKAKIISLKNDLQITILEVQDETKRFDTSKEENQKELKRIDDLLELKLEPSLNAQKNYLATLFDKKSRVEGMIDTKEKINVVEGLISSLSVKNVRGVKGDKVPAGVNASDVSDFLEYVEKTLKDWHYPNLNRVGFSEDLQDITIGSKNRKDQGKGYRAISCAALIISLLDYCVDKGLPHPGFVVLDSPLVTFRGAKRVSGSDVVADDTKNNFYMSLSKLPKDRQVIVLENDDPPTEMMAPFNYIAFTKDEAQGRAGFMPL